MTYHDPWARLERAEADLHATLQGWFASERGREDFKMTDAMLLQALANVSAAISALAAITARDER